MPAQGSEVNCKSDSLTENHNNNSTPCVYRMVAPTQSYERNGLHEVPNDISDDCCSNNDPKASFELEL